MGQQIDAMFQPAIAAEVERQIKLKETLRALQERKVEVEQAEETKEAPEQEPIEPAPKTEKETARKVEGAETEGSDQVHDYSSTQVNLPENEAKEIRKWPGQPDSGQSQ